MSAPERHIIKKYANRKLYDTRTSSYITLEGIAGLVRDGHEIKVVDRETGQDLTQVTLSQIVLSEEKRGPSHLIDGSALQERGQALLDYVRKTLNVPSDLVNQMERRRGDLEGVIDEAIEQTPGGVTVGGVVVPVPWTISVIGDANRLAQAADLMTQSLRSDRRVRQATYRVEADVVIRAVVSERPFVYGVTP